MVASKLKENLAPLADGLVMIPETLAGGGNFDFSSLIVSKVTNFFDKIRLKRDELTFAKLENKRSYVLKKIA